MFTTTTIGAAAARKKGSKSVASLLLQKRTHLISCPHYTQAFADSKRHFSQLSSLLLSPNNNAMGSTRNSKLQQRNLFDDLMYSDESSSPAQSAAPLIVTKGEKEFTGMRIIFLGTSAMKPTHSRNVTSLALQLEGETWMFDCGEGTQHQCLRSGMISKISRVFITHLHGDHVMGLPGLVTQLNVDRRNNPLPLQMFGPYGLKKYMLNSLVATSSQNFRLQISELLPRGSFDADGVLPDSDNIYHVLETEKFTVKAKLILHSVPCFGWVVEEKSKAGSLNVEKCRLLGLKSGKEYGELKNGNDIKLPDGRIIYSKDVVGEPQRGRKVVILGDTCDASSIVDLAQDADVVIHESTLPDEFREVAYSRGHACPGVAGSFAKRANARELFITHFGGKYSADETFIQGVMVPQAQRAFGKQEVTAAHDFLVYNIPRVKKED